MLAVERTVREAVTRRTLYRVLNSSRQRLGLSVDRNIVGRKPKG